MLLSFSNLINDFLVIFHVSKRSTSSVHLVKCCWFCSVCCWSQVAFPIFLLLDFSEFHHSGAEDFKLLFSIAYMLDFVVAYSNPSSGVYIQHICSSMFCWQWLLVSLTNFLMWFSTLSQFSLISTKYLSSKKQLMISTNNTFGNVFLSLCQLFKHLLCTRSMNDILFLSVEDWSLQWVIEKQSLYLVKSYNLWIFVVLHGYKSNADQKKANRWSQEPHILKVYFLMIILIYWIENKCVF